MKLSNIKIELFLLQVLTKYIHTLGVAKDWLVTDVLGLEPEALDWLPKPVKAIILLFPCSDTVNKIISFVIKGGNQF